MQALSYSDSSRHEADGYRYDGQSCDDLARAVGVPRLIIMETVGSTMDIAHRFAGEGTPSGTMILADRQTAGRGRGGKVWESRPGQGIWLTLVERPRDERAIEVMSIRVGLAAAKALDRFAEEPIRLKWPNDLYTGGKKLAGILVEARWREGKPEWVAIGIGINVIAPAEVVTAAGLDNGASRLEVLEEVTALVRNALRLTGSLTGAELAEFETRDLALGHMCIEPANGEVRGITERGELVVALADSVVRLRSGSLLLHGEVRFDTTDDRSDGAKDRI
ncbi:MAG: biotin--[acetyl-CoA-carboxylase] ligase [Gemmatimonadaceae bacterium]|nr:biotin--[acetyl-CoA-carboxylase] ligase [Gemmatimonadaceae bacterium]